MTPEGWRASGAGPPARLIQARLPFEEALYPGQRHRFTDEATVDLYERITDFFDRQLKDEAAVVEKEKKKR